MLEKNSKLRKRNNLRRTLRIKNCNTVSNFGNEFHQLVKFLNRESNSNPTSFHLIYIKLSDVYFKITM